MVKWDLAQVLQRVGSPGPGTKCVLQGVVQQEAFQTHSLYL